MLIAIISDIHDNLLNLDLCLSWITQNKIEAIVFCGDLTNKQTLNHLAKNFQKEIFLIQGNGELYQDADIARHPHIKNHGLIGREKIGELNIGFCHEPEKIQLLEKGPTKQALDFIFYGHTHRPWLEQKNNSIIANPGNLAGLYYPASFAILDSRNKSLELKILSHLDSKLAKTE